MITDDKSPRAETPKRLTARLGGVEHPEDVAILREWLRAAGYDASDTDLQYAWGRYSEDYWDEEWISTGGLSPEGVRQSVVGLLQYLNETLDTFKEAL